MAVAAVLWFLPWRRWSRRATLWLMPEALTLVAIHNEVAGRDGFRYGLFFMVTFVWLGLGHPQWTSAKFLPLMGIAYAVPLVAHGEYDPNAAAAFAYTVPACLLAGETVAWVAERLRTSERAVRSSEQRLVSLVRNASDVVTVLDESATIIWDSPAIAGVFGFDTGSRVGHVAAEFVHPDDSQLATSLFDLTSSRADGEARGIVRLRDARGAWRPCAIRMRNLLHDPDVHGIVVNASDLTALQETEANFRSLFESNPQVMWVYDRSTFDFLEVNDAAIARYGYTRDEFLSMTILDIRPEEDVPLVRAELSENLPKLSRHTKARHVLKDGRLIDVEVNSHNLTFRGRAAVLVAVQDVTERNVLEAQLRHQALHDALTGLSNRILVADRAQHALARARSQRTKVAVLLVDLDGFKDVNDTLGHGPGDQLLVAVASRVVDAIGLGDTAGRLGGDEFVILLEGVGGADEAIAAAERVLDALRSPFRVDGQEVLLGATIGIAVDEDGTASYESLLSAADTAMYRAKSSRRGSYIVFEPHMHEAVAERFELRAALVHGLAKGELVVHYQPIVDLESLRIAGAEALVRWQHPDRGLLGPAAFIPIAERDGVIVELGDRVLRTACVDAATWPDEASVSVNLSSREITDPNLILRLERALEDSGLPPERLTLEITESVLMEDVDTAVIVLRRVRDMGARLAIDDFGTGYSSLAYLQRLPVDVLKIDKSFIDVLGKGVEDAALVKAIIRLGRTLGLVTVAEGVEHADQLTMLRRFGGDYAQGFLLARPQPVDELVAHLDAAALPSLPDLLV